jgi:pyrophosphate--fructose-6-phosphate 1-phosphotransferase
MECSNLQKIRYGYRPKMPDIFTDGIHEIGVTFGGETGSLGGEDVLKAIFKNSYGRPLASFVRGKNNSGTKKLSVGVILSGGQAPGGHNVIAGLFDALEQLGGGSRLLGFLNGPSGLINGKHIEITSEIIDEYRNTGGFDIIGSGRTKIETPAQFEASLENAKKNNLDAIVIIGGDDSNTNAALLAEYFFEKKSGIAVIGCPKTIDGDLKNQFIETSFGFDTACKTYSELAGNIARDANSAKKYWHFIKLMGRAASHIALETALQVHPNICLISEEIEKKAISLSQIIDQICDSVIKRADNGDNFGVVLIPEGLIEFIPEVKALISELNDLVACNKEQFAALTSFDSQCKWLGTKLSGSSLALFSALPEEISEELLLDRDPHGNVQVSRIETEKLLIIMCEKKLAALKSNGKFKGSFSPLGHFFGYEGRSAAPTNFDADYCYSLGFNAVLLIMFGLSGYISSVRNLTANVRDWTACGVPLTMMMNIEHRKGEQKPVIKKALVELDGAPFKAFEKQRSEWAEKTSFVYPGAIQYFGPPEICDQTTITLQLESGK